MNRLGFTAVVAVLVSMTASACAMAPAENVGADEARAGYAKRGGDKRELPTGPTPDQTLPTELTDLLNEPDDECGGGGDLGTRALCTEIACMERVAIGDEENVCPNPNQALTLEIAIGGYIRNDHSWAIFKEKDGLLRKPDGTSARWLPDGVVDPFIKVGADPSGLGRYYFATSNHASPHSPDEAQFTDKLRYIESFPIGWNWSAPAMTTKEHATQKETGRWQWKMKPLDPKDDSLTGGCTASHRVPQEPRMVSSCTDSCYDPAVGVCGWTGTTYNLAGNTKVTTVANVLKTKTMKICQPNNTTKVVNQEARVQMLEYKAPYPGDWFAAPIYVQTASLSRQLTADLHQVHVFLKTSQFPTYSMYARIPGHTEWALFYTWAPADEATPFDLIKSLREWEKVSLDVAWDSRACKYTINAPPR